MSSRTNACVPHETIKSGRLFFFQVLRCFYSVTDVEQPTRVVQYRLFAQSAPVLNLNFCLSLLAPFSLKPYSLAGRFWFAQPSVLSINSVCWHMGAVHRYYSKTLEHTTGIGSSCASRTTMTTIITDAYVYTKNYCHVFNKPPVSVR